MIKSGARSAIAIIGNMIVPVPVMGAIVGSIIGGFAGSAIFSAITALLKKKILLEPLSYYCLAMLQSKGKWVDDFTNSDDQSKIFEGFCRTISYVCPLEPSALGSIVKQ